jgi:hypothetical protein
MLKATDFLPGTFACLLALGAMSDALAGEVKLVSDTWDYVCRVDVTWGPGAPDGTPMEQHIDVSRNWSISKPDRLCYRRPSTPDNCDSGMTRWTTRWQCADSAGVGVEELSLK